MLPDVILFQRDTRQLCSVLVKNAQPQSSHKGKSTQMQNEELSIKGEGDVSSKKYYKTHKKSL